MRLALRCPQPALAFMVLSFLIAGPAGAADTETVSGPGTVRAVRLDEPVVLDGLLLEDAWQGPGESRLVQNDPVNGVAPRHRTEFWVAYDDAAVFVAARMHDSAPDSIAARLGRRDTWPSSDWIYINLDTFNDDRNAFSFSINPAGVIGDSALYNDGWGDSTWDGVWEAATNIDGQGWTLEVRIPFSQLKFPDTDQQVWGFNFSRRILRYNERDDLFHLPRDEAGYGRRFPDLVGISGVRPGSKAEVRAYGLLKGEALNVDPGDPFREDPQLSGNAGLDVKTALSNNLTMNATVNPDFGQVEVDPAVVNLSAYETFFEEKRPFFVEDANIFRFGEEGTSSNWNFNWMSPLLFYSRRVGRYPQIGIEGSPDWEDGPQSTTILGATKISGKVGDTSVGAFTAFTAREKAHLQTDGREHDQVVEPFTNYSVVRAKHARPDGSRGLGFLATSTVRKLDDPVSQAELDKRSFTGGIDGWTHLDEDGVWALKAYLAGSHVTGSPEAIDALQTSSRHAFDRPGADHLSYDPGSTTMTGWQGRAAVNKESGDWLFNSAAGYSSPGYEINDVGFAYYTDVINWSVVGGYRWTEPNRLFRNQSVNLATYKTWDTGGTPDNGGFGAWYWAQFANFWSLDGMVFFNPERNDIRATRGGPVMRAPGYREFDLNLSSDGRRSWSWSVGGGASGDDAGSHSGYGSLSLEVHPVQALGVTLSPRYRWSQDEAQYYDVVADPLMESTFGKRYVFADLEYRQFSLETRIDWTFTPKLTLQTYVQPLFASGDYSDLKELARPGTFDFNRYGQDGGSTLVYDPQGDADNPYLVTPPGGSGADAFRLADQDFNFKSLKINLVLRWEYAAGSTFFFVWTQDRANLDDPGRFDLGRDVRSLLDAPGEDIFMVKVSQYFSL
ncbi:MAG: DUF5916 domain-containing protein [Candidatus Krumholzibacteriia bacterium]